MLSVHIERVDGDVRPRARRGRVLEVIRRQKPLENRVARDDPIARGLFEPVPLVPVLLLPVRCHAQQLRRRWMGLLLCWRGEEAGERGGREGVSADVGHAVNR